MSKRESIKKLKAELACTCVRAHHAQVGAIIEVLKRVVNIPEKKDLR